MSTKMFHIKCVVLLCLAMAMALALWFLPPLAQNPQYNHFADSRTYFGISNTLNVISNIPFLIVGILGLWRVFTMTDDCRVFYAVFFLGVCFVCFGSSYYHWHPVNNRLTWDRLPMSVGFMAFFTAIIAERISLGFAKTMFVPFLLLGISSVVYWHHTETLGHGDLRSYIFIQFFPMIAIPYMLLAFSNKYVETQYLWFSLIAYAFAKICELFDKSIYDITHHIISGHTIKHLLAALSCYCIYRHVSAREEIVRNS